jgi:hypothetical protein
MAVGVGVAVGEEVGVNVGVGVELGTGVSVWVGRGMLVADGDRVGASVCAGAQAVRIKARIAIIVNQIRFFIFSPLSKKIGPK